MKTFITISGKYIEAPTRKIAEQVEPILGELIMTIPCVPGTNDPDWDKAEDLTLKELN